MKEAVVNREFSIPANDQTAGVLQPRKRLFDRPATFVVAHILTGDSSFLPHFRDLGVN